MKVKLPKQCWPAAARSAGPAQMVALRPIANVAALSEAADRVWATMERSRTGWKPSPAIRASANANRPQPSERSTAWSQQEQSGASSASTDVLRELAEGNALYEQRFGFTYIVCATGKSADEMLAILERRLANDRMAELREAAEQQRQIMQIRLGKWLLS